MRKVFFRADAGADIGYGHFIRTLALADMLKDDFDCTFFTQTPTDYQRQEVANVCKLVELPSSDEKFQKFLDFLKGDEIVVLDNYFYTTDYQRKIKDKGCKLVCVDDMHDKHYVADVVVNHGAINGSLYSCESYTKLCLGLQYALLRMPFLSQGTKGKSKGHWLVSFGGTDYDNLTSKYVGYLHTSPSVKSITVVVGDAYKHTETLANYSEIEIKKNLSARQMRQEMSRAEFAILPSSSVCIEAISCGCKIASGYFVDNQKEFANVIAKCCYVYPLGDLRAEKDISFIDELSKFEFSKPSDFSEVPMRYIKLFKQLYTCK